MIMADIPKIARQRLQATAKAGVHPDPDLLAAFAEKSLGERERAQMLEHLAQCADCREVVSLAIPELEPAAHAASARPAKSPWLRWPVLRWGALAACVVVVGAAVTLRHQKREGVGTLGALRQEAPVADAEKYSDEARVSKTASDQMVAKIEPQSLPQSKRDIANPSQRAKQLGRSDSALGNKKSPVTPSGMDQIMIDANASPAAKRAAAAPAPAPLSKTADAEQQKEGSAGKAGNEYAARASEAVTVEVTATVPEVVEAAPGKAKDAKDSRSKAQSVAVGGVAAGVTTSPAGGGAALSMQTRNYAQLQNLVKLLPRWTLSSEGALQRSLDAGKTWETIPLSSTAVFRALSALDSEIWVGGSGGALYHSSDAGQHWVQVKPTTDGKSLTADIVGLEFTDARRGKLTTASGETWITMDAGQSWQKK
ncbi:MAG: hypothetical protein AUG13_03040 [Chloroflexi bacterium 13_1_20CM_2_59_7]|nr:MAG: hypothetical protein AUG13_03040 [Chloroflexi bacterium 13_1_20CM_2_59_7]